MNFVKFKNRWGREVVMESSLYDSLQAIKAGMDVAGYTVDAFEGWRGAQAQEHDFQCGVSHAHFGSSAHNFAVGMDIIKDEKGQPVWPPSDDIFWVTLGEIGSRIGLEWGGGWSPNKQDRPHFDLKGWQSMNLTLYPQEPPCSNAPL